MRTIHPCGTTAAYARHLKAKETPCPPCRAAEARNREDIRLRKVAESLAPIPTVEATTDGITITATETDDRIIAAAILDRALAAERAGDDTTSMRLKMMHRKLAQTTRAVAA